MRLWSLRMIARSWRKRVALTTLSQSPGCLQQRIAWKRFAISNCWSCNNLSSRQLGSQMKEPPSCFSSSLVSSIREETYLEKWVTWACRERERRCLLHNSTIFPNSTELLTTSRWRYARLEREMKWIFQLLSRRYVKHEKLHFTRNGIRQIRIRRRRKFDQRCSFGKS